MRRMLRPAQVPHYNNGHDTHRSARPRYLDRILFGRAACSPMRRLLRRLAARRVAASTRTWLRHEPDRAPCPARVCCPRSANFSMTQGSPLESARDRVSARAPARYRSCGARAPASAQGLAFGSACRSCRSERCSRARSSRVCGSHRFHGCCGARCPHGRRSTGRLIDTAAGEWARSGPHRSMRRWLRLPDAPFTLAGNAAAAFGERLPAVSAAFRVDYEALPHALPVALARLARAAAGRTCRPNWPRRKTMPRQGRADHRRASRRPRSERRKAARKQDTHAEPVGERCAAQRIAICRR